MALSLTTFTDTRNSAANVGAESVFSVLVAPLVEGLSDLSVNGLAAFRVFFNSSPGEQTRTAEYMAAVQVPEDLSTAVYSTFVGSPSFTPRDAFLRGLLIDANVAVIATEMNSKAVQNSHEKSRELAA